MRVETSEIGGRYLYVFFNGNMGERKLAAVISITGLFILYSCLLFERAFCYICRKINNHAHTKDSI